MAPVVIGIDIGSSGSFVGFVGKGIVDIVQNEVSQRLTPSLVGFDQRERLLGDAAMAKVKSNAKSTCRNFKHLLGHKVDAPRLETEKFWSLCSLATAEDGFAGYEVSYKGESRIFSATQVTAMYLTKLKDITEKWTNGQVTDAVIGVPSYFSDVHRQALLDASKIANINVLRLMNEHTATALGYGIYRSNDFDAEKPLNVAFCSMGHSMFSVSVIQFVKGKLKVLCEKSDKVGGRDMDECLMREFAAQFAKKHGLEPLTNKKAMIKLEDAVNKTKKTLSANSEAPVSVECLMEDYDFSSNITREDFQKMCQPMMARVKVVLEDAKKACGIQLAEISSVEVTGGASRVPWLKVMISEAFGGKELSTTMNADECVARGCALQAAILSPLYKVREFTVEDLSTHAVSIGWDGDLAVDPEGNPSGAPDGGPRGYQTAPIFPAGSMLNLLKMLTFYRKGSFDLKAFYPNEAALEGTAPELGSFRIEVPAQGKAKKVKVKAKLTMHGTFALEGAQLLEEEEYEETLKEKRELPAEEEKKEGEAEKEGEGDGKKESEKKVEWVDVVKKKVRVKRTDLKITATGCPGLPSAVLQAKCDEESAMISEQREIVETDEKRNDLESYIFNTRDKLEGEYAPFISSADKDKFNKDLQTAEDWLYDTEDATKLMYVDKLNELKVIGDPVVWRMKEAGLRSEWVDAVTGTITNYRAAAENPGDRYGHIAPEKLSKISAACGDLEKWLNEMKGKQDGMAKHERPVLICAEMEKKNQELANMADAILKEPKPAPPKEEKKEEAKEEEKPKDGAEPPPEAAPEAPQNMDVD
eukprot:gnl/TRDRNA2_/TRDRNA2_170883_c0_seq12.p1 gnl/TRDRNA2_/TRDRNA2_170883_c0~~gnl/TRDRNA2_/TRDRNA2_170883_c0_seq12.p1  ORF type:complete len:813 (-),score=241.52 gnl/TRDRNA2_/TRDRNA2_170883_c0_seq12:121-2559(-)